MGIVTHRLSMDACVTFDAQRDQVLFDVIAGLAAEFEVVYL